MKTFRGHCKCLFLGQFCVRVVNRAIVNNDLCVPFGFGRVAHDSWKQEVTLRNLLRSFLIRVFVKGVNAKVNAVAS